MTFTKWDFEHIDRLALLEQTIFKDSWSKNAILGAIHTPVFHGFCLFDGEEIVGYYGIYIIEPEGHIANIAVIPERRGEGISNLLIEHMTKYASERGVTDFTLEVRASNAVAISLYEKHGFILEGRRKEYYSDKEDALIYWKRK